MDQMVWSWNPDCSVVCLFQPAWPDRRGTRRPAAQTPPSTRPRHGAPAYGSSTAPRAGWVCCPSARYVSKGVSAVIGFKGSWGEGGWERGAMIFVPLPEMMSIAFMNGLNSIMERFFFCRLLILIRQCNIWTRSEQKGVERCCRCDDQRRRKYSQG